MHLRHGCGDLRGRSPHVSRHRQHLIVLDQALHLPAGAVRVVSIVQGQQLDLPAMHAARRVDFLEMGLHASHHGLAEDLGRTGQGRGGAQANRFRRARGRGGEQSQEGQVEADECAQHGYLKTSLCRGLWFSNMLVIG